LFLRSLGDALEELTRHSLLRRNLEEDTFRIHRLVPSEYQARMGNAQEKFDAAVKLLLLKLPYKFANKNNNDNWILYDRYIPQVLAWPTTTTTHKRNPTL
jgi:hypothetical protein